MNKKILVIALLALVASFAVAATPAMAQTVVPGHGHERYDRNGNDYPDDGVYVNGHYTALYAYDDTGNWYWDLGDGRTQGTVDSVDELDSSTLTTCDYVNNYRADFGDDPFMDEGWIQNHINCSGYDDNGTYNYLIVSDEDPRYTGGSLPPWGGGWEYFILTIDGTGDYVHRLLRPQNHQP